MKQIIILDFYNGAVTVIPAPETGPIDLDVYEEAVHQWCDANQHHFDDVQWMPFDGTITTYEQIQIKITAKDLPLCPPPAQIAV